MDSINWTQFEAVNENTTKSFEDLCRNLFKRQFFTKDIVFNSKPNHPGTEIYPLFSEVTGSIISFQAKFLSRNDYPQIKKSTDKVINNYSNKLDILYLYCNRELDIESAGFTKIKDSLGDAGIKIELITNKEILDQVITHKDLYSYYFKKHSIDNKWFEDESNKSLAILGPRYNPELNEKTEAESYINLFIRDEEAIIDINNKKKYLKDYLLDLNREISSQKISKVVDSIIDGIKNLDDVDYYTMDKALKWSSQLKNEFSNSIEIINNEINDINEKKDELSKELKIDNLQNEYHNQLNELDRKSLYLKKLLNFYKEIELSENEKEIINNKMLILTGKAGSGKSHLFGSTNKRIIDRDDYSILILGHTFINNNTVMNQIMENYGLDYSFNEFLDILEGIGSINNRDVYIFIDAVNESNFKKIWKNNLSNLYEEINKRKFIKLIVSIRNGYENYVLNEHIKNEIKNNKISKIEHFGFSGNSIEVMNSFFNYYNITFSPSDFLNYELTNPLFLKLYCEVYSKDERSFSKLFEDITDATYSEVKEKLNIEEEYNILKDLLLDIASVLYKNNSMSISRKELNTLKYWREYNLSTIKIIPILLKNGLLVNFHIQDEEYYSFSYNLLGDYLQAKYIVNKSRDIKDLYTHTDYLLKINDGKIEKINNLDIFNFVCELSFKRFSVDPINETLRKLKDEGSISLLLDKYIEGQSIRDSSSIDIQSFNKIVKNNPIVPETFFKMLIENSLKSDRELNSNYLHNVLYKENLNNRDRIWTTYINQLAHDEDRLYQIIKYIEEGRSIDSLNMEDKKHLITLLAWLFTSSNRNLRDKASKALIEVLKNSYDLCLYTLERFEGVNDPYVIQRLYGCVFGACTKNLDSNKQEFKKLAEYVYLSVFNKENVYPDILLRDYARLIIEKYLSINKNGETSIDKKRIHPPYNSEKIPIVPEKEYYDEELLIDNGLNRIDFSMRPDIKGLGYGDFGRYVFQAALNYFNDVDILNLYHYAMHYIIDNLGYKNELFGVYDYHIGYTDRHDTKKLERIGKKYQWIAFYNILARVSDKYKLEDLYNDGDKFIGPWNPYVRDFDPTVNINISLPDDQKPKFTIYNKEEFISEQEKDDKKITEWTKLKANMFDESLIQSDDSSREWIVLYNFKELYSKADSYTKNSEYNRNGEQNIWRISQGYFIKEEEFNRLKKSLINKNFLGRWFPEGYSSIYNLFNREYYWSSGYKDTFTHEWSEYFKKTGEKQIIQREGKLPKLDGFGITFESKKWEEEIELKEKVADILPAFHKYVWEEEFDASQEEPVSFHVPCKELITSLIIQQKNYDGYFYDDKDELIAYDSVDNKYSHRFLIRKDYIDKFLKEKNYVLFWTNMGEKRFNIGIRDLKHSEWSGFTWYDKGKYQGEMSNKRVIK
ncbi:MAG: NACHT domain-containing protein [Anaerococcus sp.]